MAMTTTTPASLCPVTAGRPTTMTLISFQAICKSKRHQQFADNYINKYCQICLGKTMPNELTLLKKLPKIEDFMPAKLEGKCELCGQEKSLVSSNGKKVCSTCSVVIGVVRNRPLAVIGALREFASVTEFLTDKEKELISGSKEAVNSESSLYPSYKKEIDSLKRIIDGLTKGKDEFESLASFKSTQIRNMENLRNVDLEIIDDLRNKVKELENITKRQNLCINSMAPQAANENVFVETSQYDKDKIMTILVDLAQAHIDGKVCVKSDHFKELRKAATA